MTHRDGLPRFAVRSVRCGDAGHREACAPPSESLGKPPYQRSLVLTMEYVSDFALPFRKRRLRKPGNGIKRVGGHVVPCLHFW